MEACTRSKGRCRLEQVQGGLAPGERTMEEPGVLSRGRCRLRQVQGGSASGERAMEEPGSRSRGRGRCRLGKVQGA